MALAHQPEGPGRLPEALLPAAAKTQQDDRLSGADAEAERRAQGFVGSILGIQSGWIF